MDDYNISSLQESNNEWVSRLVSILTPCIVNGCNSIYKEAYQLCIDNEEEDKYLMTFQNFLSRIPKWNPDIVTKEVERIRETSGCDYLEDLMTCVHVIQLKALTCIRVGMEHRAIDIEIPKLDAFIHKVYILLARKLYTNVYLYEENIPPLDQQRNNREMEIMVRECILEAVRESIPIESILKAYLDKTVEENVETVVTTIKEPESVSPDIQVGGSVEDQSPTLNESGSAETATSESATSEYVPSDPASFSPTTSFSTPASLGAASPGPASLGAASLGAASLGAASPRAASLGAASLGAASLGAASLGAASLGAASPRAASLGAASPQPIKQLTFSNIDQAQRVDQVIENVHAPKDVTTLERISEENHARRLLEEAEGDDDMEDSLNISNEDANIQLDIETL
jgi:hypothetical protein